MIEQAKWVVARFYDRLKTDPYLAKDLAITSVSVVLAVIFVMVVI
jgi:hypothetical protein